MCAITSVRQLLQAKVMTVPVLEGLYFVLLLLSHLNPGSCAWGLPVCGFYESQCDPVAQTTFCRVLVLTSSDNCCVLVVIEPEALSPKAAELQV
jgi:hypothetical protein